MAIDEIRRELQERRVDADVQPVVGDGGAEVAASLRVEGRVGEHEAQLVVRAEELDEEAPIKVASGDDEWKAKRD